MNNPGGYKKIPEFYVINFDDPSRSHRCNPLNPAFMSDISDAYESAYTIMLNLNKTWVQKQGDFFVESPIILFAAIIWFLRIYEGGKGMGESTADLPPQMNAAKIFCHLFDKGSISTYFPITIVISIIIIIFAA